jgi:predicted nucleic acid-binding protein
MARRLILDSGAVIALASNDPDLRAYLRIARRADTVVIVPAVVIAETTRGTGTDVPVNRTLRQATEIAPIDEAVARIAGRLLRRLGSNHPGHSPPTIDALIAAVAITHGGGVLLTADPADLIALLADFPEVHVRHWRA